MSSPQVIFEEAVALQRQGDLKSAIRRYKKLLKQVPDHPQILNMCALATAELGDMSRAIKMLDKAVKSDPDFADGWVNLGVIQQKKGDFEAAVASYDRFRTLKPESPIGHLNFANACQLLKRFDEAVPAYERVVSSSPNDTAAWANLARAQLHIGAWEKSLEAADRALSLAPGHTGALAIKSAVLLELGRNDAVDALVDFDRLIEVKDFSAPEGYADLKSFNAALCDHCLAHPSLKYEPSDNTTMKGYQTGNLSLDENQGPIAHLLEMIGMAVKEYQDSHADDPPHPFLARKPARWEYDIWATVLGSQGHQAPHIHRSGWLSGCYYARIPDVISPDSDSQAGWIEFGRPQEHPKAKATPRVRSYAPHEGMVVLFPSYFYHRTEPFESQEKRISIAFDLLPAQ